MKKFVIAAAFAATVMSTGAQAFGASSADTCGAFDNHNRFNPVELSEYQECWLDFHKPDEAAGIIGNIFWARAGDGFVSMPVSELREAGSKEAARAVVLEAVYERIIEVRIVERIEEIYTGRDQLIAQLGTGEANVEAALEEIRSLQAEAMDLEEVMTAISANELVSYVDGGITVDSSAVVSAAVTNTRARYLLQYIADPWNGSEGYAHSNTRADAAFTGATADETLNGEEYDVFDRDDNLLRTFTNSSAARTFSLGQEGRYVVGRSLDTWSASINGSTITFADSLVDNQLVSRAVEAAYNVGFDDGYDEGYADGYRDGFADGVESVR